MNFEYLSQKIEIKNSLNILLDFQFFKKDFWLGKYFLENKLLKFNLKNRLFVTLFDPCE